MPQQPISFPYHLECTECQAQVEASPLATLCDACHRPYQVQYQLSPTPREQVIDADATGLWRFRGVLPLPRSVSPVTLGEGDTPLLTIPRIARELGATQLYYKDEGVNPTGSFKARGMSVAVSMAVLGGATTLAAPSAGNAGGALAAYGARAGVPVVLAMPEDVPATHRLEAQLCGAELHLRPGTIADCGRWLAQQCKKHGWFDLSTLKEPYRVEGKKTLGYELVEQLGGTLPDVIFYPTGGGTGLVGLCKAFREQQALGWLAPGPLPRMVAVQASGCAPIASAWSRHLADGESPEHPETVASGLRVPTPVGDRWILRELRASGGFALAVNDAALLRSTRRLARLEGLIAAPEAGALIAALELSLQQGRVHADDRIVLLGTGMGIKYQECLQA